jgi:transposase
MLIVGYCFGVRSERRLCEDVYLNPAYRWFCRLGLDGEVPDHSTFFKNRHGRFRECGLLRKLFETVVATRSDVLSRTHYPPPTPASR